MTSPRPGLGSLLRLLVLMGVLSGCATFSQHLGIRPDEPAAQTKSAACDEYERYSKYAQELQEAYHARATQNRGWIYVAGVLGLGVAAASGGLAVATAVGAGTLGLLSISGGFAAGTFATINNSDLALSYTVAANSVDQALKSARGQIAFDANSGYTNSSCALALSTLNDGVSDARTHLEVARTNNAAGALARAKDQLGLLNAQIASVQTPDLTHVTLAAEIVNVDPASPPAGPPPTDTAVTITVKNAKLDQIGLSDVKVEFGTKGPLRADAIAQPDPVNAPYTYTVTFTAPATRPDPNQNTYTPVVIIQGKTRVENKVAKTFKYPP